jgi:probable phosphoglycerate mutase
VSNTFIIEADGGSRGNPGPAGAGAVVIDAQSGEIVAEIAEFIGIATNNVAEYRAIRAGLEHVLRLDAQAKVLVRMDSKLVIEQLSGNWKIKHPDMRALAIEVQSLAADIEVDYQWIPRELNSRADAMANKAMDDEASSMRTFADLDRKHEVDSALGEFNTVLPSSIRAPQTSGVAPTTIVLVRHGRTALTEQNRISGRGGADPELSDSGVKDAEAVAKELAKFGRPGSFSHLEPISAVIASPIRRTVETARVIASKVGIPDKTDERFAEISFGDWDGLTHDQAQQLDTELFEAWRGSWTVAPPNGENLADFDARVIEGLGDAIEQNTGKTIALVAHVMPIRGVIRAAINGAIDVYWRVQVAPCSITILRFWGLHSAEVITINSTSHLNQG